MWRVRRLSFAVLQSKPRSDDFLRNFLKITKTYTHVDADKSDEKCHENFHHWNFKISTKTDAATAKSIGFYSDASLHLKILGRDELFTHKHPEIKIFSALIQSVKYFLSPQLALPHQLPWRESSWLQVIRWHYRLLHEVESKFKNCVINSPSLCFRCDYVKAPRVEISSSWSPLWASLTVKLRLAWS